MARLAFLAHCSFFLPQIGVFDDSASNATPPVRLDKNMARRMKHETRFPKCRSSSLRLAVKKKNLFLSLAIFVDLIDSSFYAMTITRHVVLHAVADLLREIRLALQDAVPLRVRAVVTQLPLGREETPPLTLRYRDYPLARGRYPRPDDRAGLLARRDREREIGDLRRLHRIVKQHL